VTLNLAETSVVKRTSVAKSQLYYSFTNTLNWLYLYCMYRATVSRFVVDLVIQVSRYADESLYRCVVTQVCRYTGESLHRWVVTQVSRYTGESLYRCVVTQVSRYTGVSLYRCVVIQVCRYTGVSLHGCVVTQVSRYTGELLYRCVVTQVCRYTGELLYRWAGVCQHLQLRNGAFCCCKLVLHARAWSMGKISSLPPRFSLCRFALFLLFPSPLWCPLT